MGRGNSLGNWIPTHIDYQAVKREAWRDHGILVVDVATATTLSWVDRQHLRNIGDQLYGRWRPADKPMSQRRTKNRP